MPNRNLSNVDLVSRLSRKGQGGREPFAHRPDMLMGGLSASAIDGIKNVNGQRRFNASAGNPKGYLVYLDKTGNESNVPGLMDLLVS